MRPHMSKALLPSSSMSTLQESPTPILVQGITIEHPNNGHRHAKTCQPKIASK